MSALNNQRTRTQQQRW